MPNSIELPPVSVSQPEPIQNDVLHSQENAPKTEAEILAGLKEARDAKVRKMGMSAYYNEAALFGNKLIEDFGNETVRKIKLFHLMSFSNIADGPDQHLDIGDKLIEKYLRSL